MGKLLDLINDPGDLKKINQSLLPQLAQEIRETIIETVSKTGGHLASSLGVVELTIALHYVLDTPQDKIIWDVGHQCYAHKLLTGRKDRFSTLRQHEGISGFPSTSESIYDVFDTGHSGTSISAALGMACARDLKKLNYKVAAVIGDGSMTSGIAFEALNNAGHLKKDLIVILNDNEMFISPKVGALASYLTRIFSNPAYTKFREEFDGFLKSIPKVGNKVHNIAKRFDENMRAIFAPGMIFEEMGFDYIGPTYGHDLNNLIKILQNITYMKGPVLFHIITKKGKGYAPAENFPVSYHGVDKFDIATGKVIKIAGERPSYTKIFSSTITQLGKKYNNLVAITAAMPDGTGLQDFANTYPDRFFDVGIAEQHAVTMAAGMCKQGLKPVVAIYSTFLQRAFDQIIHDVCIQNLPVIFAIDRSGIVGQDGKTHQGIFDISYLRLIPNLVIMSPKDENELRHMLKTAIEYNEHPVCIRYPRAEVLGVNMDEELKILPIGKSEVLKEGKDMAIFGFGFTVRIAEETATVLKEKHNISATVINTRFVKPLDTDLLKKLARDIPCFITIEENVLSGGFGSAIIEFLEQENMLSQVKIIRIGLPDKFIEHGHPEILRDKYNININSIVSRIIKKE
ncbi:1-deoxy-D-xylulose-5-phosphate synthase [Candidatus Desantisbacteria bacterium]|nr:1-deoxy-D-xylulose-5-phosphate synthase [Candidatus Desantisbacteria bacterium]